MYNGNCNTVKWDQSVINTSTLNVIFKRIVENLSLEWYWCRCTNTKRVRTHTTSFVHSSNAFCSTVLSFYFIPLIINDLQISNAVLRVFSWKSEREREKKTHRLKNGISVPCCNLNQKQLCPVFEHNIMNIKKIEHYNSAFRRHLRKQ